MNDLLALDFMRQALLAALLAGFAAPLVGVFLVQRRLSLIGDGMGHVALAGVAVGVLTNQAPVLTALVAAVVAAVAIELIRASGRTSGDIALAVMFYGGIAAVWCIIASARAARPANLDELPVRRHPHHDHERHHRVRRAGRGGPRDDLVLRPACSRWPTTRSTPAPRACRCCGSTSCSPC